MSLFFTEKELEWSPYLVGTWIGRSSWAPGGAFRPTAGAYILHTESLPEEQAQRIRSDPASATAPAQAGASRRVSDEPLAPLRRDRRPPLAD